MKLLNWIFSIVIVGLITVIFVLEEEISRNQYTIEKMSAWIIGSWEDFNPTIREDIMYLAIEHGCDTVSINQEIELTFHKRNTWTIIEQNQKQTIH